jgi:hypothetical protein
MDSGVRMQEREYLNRGFELFILKSTIEGSLTGRVPPRFAASPKMRIGGLSKEDKVEGVVRCERNKARRDCWVLVRIACALVVLPLMFFLDASIDHARGVATSSLLQQAPVNSEIAFVNPSVSNAVSAFTIGFNSHALRSSVRVDVSKAEISRPSTCYCVSPTGNDNNDGTRDVPFLTLEKAREEMRRNQTKCTVLLPGIYDRTSPLTLTSADSGETWQGTGDVLISGSGTQSDIILILGGSNITITNLKMANAAYRGVGIHGGLAFADDPAFNTSVPAATGNKITNTEIYNIAPLDYTGPAYWNSGGVAAQGRVIDTTIENNFFHDMNSMGLGLRAEGQAGDDISGGMIRNNILIDTMKAITADGGAIYVQDIGARSANIVISNNYISNYQGATAKEGHGIYLDQAASNILVTDNFIQAGASAGEGTTAFLLSSGNNVTFSNNIIDLGSTAQVSIAGILKYPTGYTTNMANNVISSNIIVMNFAGEQKTAYFGLAGYSYMFGGNGVVPPTISNNVYKNYGGGEERTDGHIQSDANPIHLDPLLISSDRLLPGSPVFRHPVDFRQFNGLRGPPWHRF